MCFDSGGKEADKQAQQARADEQARQERIRAGTKRIGEIFEGGALSGTNPLTAGATYDPTRTYYTAAGTPWTLPTQPTTGGASGGHWETQIGRTGDHGAASNQQTWVPYTAAEIAAQKANQKTPQQLFTEALSGGQVFGGQARSKGTFGPEFYANLRKSFTDYAMPQLGNQYSDAKRQLIFALDRQGLLDSSVKATKSADLTKLYDTNAQDIAAQANDYVKQTKGQVEDARTGLIQTLNATGDAEGAAQSAIRRAQALSAPPKYSPLSQLFTDFTAGLGQQAGLERAGFYSGQPVARYNTGIFTPNRRSVSVT